MTFADLLYKIWCAISAHRTKLVGCAITLLGSEALRSLLPPQWLAICTTTSGLLTILCGVANTSTIAAKAAALQNPIQPAAPASSRESKI